MISQHCSSLKASLLKKTSAFASSIVLTAGVSLTAFGGTPIVFDPDGQGGANGPTTVISFDWAVGNGLITSQPSQPGGGVPDVAIPNFPGDVLDLQVLAHAALAGYADSNGDPAGAPAGLNQNFEITFYVSHGSTLTNVNGALVEFDQDDQSPANFFNILYHEIPPAKANSLSGVGYSDGQVILAGKIVRSDGLFVSQGETDPVSLLDKVNPDNWAETETVVGEGSQDVTILVVDVDSDFFVSGIGPGSLLEFNTSTVLPYQQTNPSFAFDIDESGFPLLSTVVGAVNGITGPELLLQADANNDFVFIPQPQACRVTGGSNDTSGIGRFEDGSTYYDGTTTEGSASTPDITEEVCKGGKDGTKNCTTQVVQNGTYYEWTNGGQAGANTAKQPQPKGEWEHNNHVGPGGLQFAFHAGTSSAGPGTEIDEIRCTDPLYCQQARPAPNKQIDFVGIGEFSNFQVDDEAALLTAIALDDGHIWDGIQNVVAGPAACNPNGNGPNACWRQPPAPPSTYHWFQVHIEDAGEPGNKFEGDLGQTPEGGACPLITNGVYGHGNDPFLEPPRDLAGLDICPCADFYRITIYQGFDPQLDDNGEIGAGVVIPKGDDEKIYEVWGYLNGGNFQIHPLTGFDLR